MQGIRDRWHTGHVPPSLPHRKMHNFSSCNKGLNPGQQCRNSAKTEILWQTSYVGLACFNEVPLCIPFIHKGSLNCGLVCLGNTWYARKNPKAGPARGRSDASCSFDLFFVEFNCAKATMAGAYHSHSCFRAIRPDITNFLCCCRPFRIVPSWLFCNAR